MPRGGGGGGRGGGGGGGRRSGGSGGGSSINYGWSWGSAKSYPKPQPVAKPTEPISDQSILCATGHWRPGGQANDEHEAQIHREITRRTPLTQRLGMLDRSIFVAGAAGTLAFVGMLMHPSGRAWLVKRWRQVSANIVRAGNKSDRFEGYRENKL